jgi:hypothetical protein
MRTMRTLATTLILLLATLVTVAALLAAPHAVLSEEGAPVTPCAREPVRP